MVTLARLALAGLKDRSQVYIYHRVQIPPLSPLSPLPRIKEGNIHPQTKWEEAMLPYVLAEGETLDEYERRTDEFNKFNPVKRTDAKIGGLGASRTRADNSGKEADACFRPSKPPVQSPNGSNGKNEPWPNLVVEVAYSESEQHVLDNVKKYWLGNFSRVHDAIVIKIDPVSGEDEPPTRMQAWHFCITDKRTRTSDIQHRNHFEFGTLDKDGNQTNIQQGQCVIKISLDCLYHDASPGITIPRQLLPDPIELDFLLIRNDFLSMY
ncbi:4036_t:CDS:2 [Funneliformis mosseae]|uniref:4036_t:CDS:1 n=1 Tax=Funneliformis mosseae TaxID=27381 RepID=A0A9N9HRU4_FUNMO|nr:4036_t:CDS:2 [Funneliformis mosseae]